MPEMKTFSLKLFLCALLTCCICSLAPYKALAAEPLSERDLVDALKKEEVKAKERRGSLSRLTAEERRLNSDLAEAEARILKLEGGIDEQQAKLSQLAGSGEDLQKKYEELAKERLKAEEALSEVLRTLWELHSRRLAVGGRDLPDWHVTDREYIWSNTLFASLEAYRTVIQDQEVELGKIAHNRRLVGESISAQMSQIVREKEKLLTERVRYAERLAVLRNEKQDTEAELSSTLQLISNLNFSIKSAREKEAKAAKDEQAARKAAEKSGQVSLPDGTGASGGNIEKGKGSLPSPVAKGKRVFNYKPDGVPPMRGLGFSTAAGTEVRAVHNGRVMFNDTMRGLGQVVVIQHGEAYYTVYAFLSESLVRGGQEVARGQGIGRTGFYPAINGPGLYFELRFHQKAINPEQWLAQTN